MARISGSRKQGLRAFLFANQVIRAGDWARAMVSSNVVQQFEKHHVLSPIIALLALILRG
jgi:hypothetical protein